MIKKIVFCLILLCCMSSVVFAETSDNVNGTVDNHTSIDKHGVIDFDDLILIPDSTPVNGGDRCWFPNWKNVYGDLPIQP